MIYSYWLQPETLAATRFKRRRSLAKVVTRVHGADLYESRKEPAYLPFRKAMLEAIDAVHCVSEHGRKYLVRAYPWVAEKVQVSRLGVEDPRFLTRHSDDGVLRVVSCSFMAPVKRLDLLIGALAEYAVRFPDSLLEWHHLGDGPLRPNIEAMCREQLDNRVQWTLHGALPNQDVLGFYREHAIDVFINVSSSEGVPVSIMEAQSCGIPIVATAVGGTPEIVDDDAGILLPSDPEPVEIATALRTVAVEVDRVAYWRRGSRARWAERYDAARNYTSFLEALKA